MRMHEFYKKTASYPQALLRVGIPIIAAYRVTDYLIFRLMRGNRVALHYLSWQVFGVMDVLTILALSTLWWSLMRYGFGKHSREDEH
jgi:branched-subunit amino acid transport protein AzlD